MSIAFNSSVRCCRSSSMPASLRFYRDILGFAVVASDRPGDDCDWCLLRQGRAELMLNTQYERDERPSAPNPARRNAHRDTAALPGQPGPRCRFRASPRLTESRPKGR